MVSISNKCPGHPFLNFLDPPLKGTSKTLCREEPNMSTVFTKNIYRYDGVVLKKALGDLQRNRLTNASGPQFLKNRESFTICLCL